MMNKFLISILLLFFGFNVFAAGYTNWGTVTQIKNSGMSL